MLGHIYVDYVDQVCSTYQQRTQQSTYVDFMVDNETPLIS